jgi:hypothetical protein
VEGCDGGTSHKIDYATDLIAVRIARSCLDDPRWIQAKVFVLWHPAEHRHYVLRDSAHTDS